MISIDSNRMRIHFDRFDQEAYQTFLRAKRLPECEVVFNDADESYTIQAPARFASMMGMADGTSPRRNTSPYLPCLFDDQVAILDMALAAKRFACWSDCGLGKTLIELEFGRQVIERTGGSVLIFTMNEIVPQTIEEARLFYGDSLPVRRIYSRAEMKEWAKSSCGELAITNYEKMNHDGGDDQVVNELRYLAGVVLDESSRLKSGGGKQKWALIKSCRGIEYKISCTATPAPNDTIEFASQASFLEKMRSDADIIWTYFHRDPKTHRWTVKRHAREAFFEFMASWSIYVRSPKRYGWRLDHPEIPEPIFMRHRIAATPEQLSRAAKLTRLKSGQLLLFDAKDTNAVERSKLSQLAKGFVYKKGKKARTRDLVKSLKPAFVADLVRQELTVGLQVLIWTVFDAESEILHSLLADMSHEVLTGQTDDLMRLAILERFRHGETRALVSRASMLGYGMNFQHCGAMIFSGWNDSYESYYQALRRAAYRYGQTKQLRIHLPVIEELEGDMLENIFSKQDKHEAAIAEMESNYIRATRAMKEVA